MKSALREEALRIDAKIPGEIIRCVRAHLHSRSSVISPGESWRKRRARDSCFEKGTLPTRYVTRLSAATKMGENKEENRNAVSEDCRWLKERDEPSQSVYRRKAGSTGHY